MLNLAQFRLCLLLCFTLFGCKEIHVLVAKMLTCVSAWCRNLSQAMKGVWFECLNLQLKDELGISKVVITEVTICCVLGHGCTEPVKSGRGTQVPIVKVRKENDKMVWKKVSEVLV